MVCPRKVSCLAGADTDTGILQPSQAEANTLVGKERWCMFQSVLGVHVVDVVALEGKWICEALLRRMLSCNTCSVLFFLRPAMLRQNRVMWRRGQ